LAAASSFGERLRRASGDALLTDAIAAIERQSDPRAIAAAHAQYRRGRLHYHAHELAAAEQDLLAAATAFERCGSPMRDVSRLYAASVMFDENRIDDATAMFEQVIRDAPPEHRSLLAEAHVQLGRCAMYEGRWSDAAADFHESAAAFRALGESANLAVAETGLADAFAGLGNREESWSHRVAAFDLTGPKLLLALSTASHSELRDQHLASAGALLKLEIDEARLLGQPLLIADAYKRRALLRARSGDAGAAYADLREARSFLARESDAGLRQRVEGECSIAEGVLLRGVDARRSVAQLTSAIGFLERSGLRFAMADALLERARSRRAAGDESAANDFDAAFAELDREKNVDTAASLLEESVDFYLARGDIARALATAERARGGEMLPVVPTQTALLEYVAVPDGIAIFCVTQGRIDHVVVRIDRDSLQASIREMGDQMSRRSASVRSSLAVLHERLIAPVAPRLADATSLVIVADRSLQTIPWAALYDAARGEYLVERASITIAPSAAVWMRNSTIAASRKGERLLLIEAEDAGGEDEVSALAALYPDHRLLAGSAATPEGILRAAGECDILHFAGHARGAGAHGDAALMLRGTDLRASQVQREQWHRPRLAVLAACSTSAMAAAFLDAGVPAVIGTLWPIEDGPASALFSELHRRLRAGVSAAEALRDAQMALIHAGGAGAHPAVWGGVEIAGGNA
jgi:CHAT domain-containing protein